jgi:3-phosphoshikimate 1-carboxyvinyltransferase
VLELAPARAARGTVRLPGSKSISNRVLLLAALAEGDTVVCDLLDADDTRLMREALSRLGVACDALGGAAWRVRGTGGSLPVKRAQLFLGNAGTAFRPLTAVLALADGEYRLAGTPRMHERPIGDLVLALRGLGAQIAFLGREGYPPLAIRPRKPGASSVRVRGEVSSQFLSALLMALPPAGGGRVQVEGILVSRPYVELTRALMLRFGVAVEAQGASAFRVPGRRYASPGEIRVEGDASSASYFLAAGALGGGPVRVEGVGRASLQGDVRFTEVLEAMGARVSTGEDWIEVASGDGRLRPIDMDLNHIPDAAMTAAVLALFAEGPSTIREVGSWRVKETDRIAAMASELRKLGAAVEEGRDFLRITPPQSSILNPGVSVATYDDHRMAMSFSLAALGGVAVRIEDPDCVSKTFPGYFAALEAILRRA